MNQRKRRSGFEVATGQVTLIAAAAERYKRFGTSSVEPLRWGDILTSSVWNPSD